MKTAFNKGIIVIFSILLLAGCGPKQKGSIVEGKINVVTSFYPIYEFTQAIGGEHVNVINLLPTGVEPHDWTPRSQDIMNTSKAQLFFYNGAGLEGWVPNFLKGLNKDSTILSVELSKGVDLIEVGEEDGHDEEADHDENNHEGHDHGSVDPHTWVSPKSALVMANNIKDSLIQVDPDHKVDYEEHYLEIVEQLTQLDTKFEEELSKLPNKQIVVSHEAFGYLTRDYGLTQHSIMGLSPDAEPRAQDIIALTKIVKENNIKYIFFEELVSDRLAKTLAGEAGVNTLILNPVEGLTKQQEQDKENYFTLMEKNLQNLILALQ